MTNERFKHIYSEIIEAIETEDICLDECEVEMYILTYDGKGYGTCSFNRKIMKLDELRELAEAAAPQILGE